MKISSKYKIVYFKFIKKKIMKLGIKGRIIAKLTSIFYRIIKPIRYLNYKIFVYLINNYFISLKKIISNNTIKILVIFG